MKTFIFTAALSLAASAAQARVVPAENYGLQPTTGYVSAVTANETCDQSKNVLLAGDSWDDDIYITKCDSSIIGWTKRLIKTSDMERNDDGSWNVKLAYTPVPATPRTPRHINIYTCGDSREDELQQDPSGTPAKDFNQVDKTLKAAKDLNLSLRIELFYNQWVLSGKCIGKIEIVP